MVFKRATFGRSANLCNAYGEESGDGGDDDDDGDIDEGHDDVWYSIEQHLKGVHKSAEGAVIGMECRKAKRENRQDLQLTFG